MSRHLSLVVVRFLLSYPLALALPVSHNWFGAQYPGDGQSGFAFLIAFAALGILAATLFFVVASIIHALLRRRATSAIVAVDSALFLILFAVLVYGGITAKYGDAIH